MSGDQERAVEQLREERARAEKAEEREKEERARAENLEEELKKTREELQANKAKLHKLSSGNSGFPAEGSIQLEVEVEKVGEELIFSDYTSIGGAAYRLGCRKHVAIGEDLLSAYLFCNDSNSSTTHSALTTVTLALLSSSPTFPCNQSSTFHFLPSHLSHKSLSVYWADVLNPVYDRVKNGSFTLGAQIKVIFCKNIGIDFASPDPDLSDVVLLVGEKEFNVSRNFLAHFCGYFKALFCSNFAEKNKKQIELKEIDPKEFEAMLDVIYPQRKKATAATVKGLLRMADFFDVHAVRTECIDFLDASTDFTLVAKLLLSEEFLLPELQYRLVESLREAKESKTVINSPHFSKLSVTLKNSLLEKHFKLLG